MRGKCRPAPRSSFLFLLIVRQKEKKLNQRKGKHTESQRRIATRNQMAAVESKAFNL